MDIRACYLTLYTMYMNIPAYAHAHARACTQVRAWAYIHTRTYKDLKGENHYSIKGGAKTYTLFCQVYQSVPVLFVFQKSFIMTEPSGQIIMIIWLCLRGREAMKTHPSPSSITLLLVRDDKEAVRYGPCS